MAAIPNKATKALKYLGYYTKTALAPRKCPLKELPAGATAGSVPTNTPTTLARQSII